MKIYPIALLLLLAGCSDTPPEYADVVIHQGTIYTADRQQTVVQALAIRAQELVYVGDDAGAQALIGPATRVIDLQGKMAMPGLHDVHVHPVLAIEKMTCVLPDQNELTLVQLVAELKHCLANLGDAAPAPGGWITVSQFNGYGAESAEFLGPYASITEGLNEITTAHNLFLVGADGHIYAVNDYALQHAATLKGQQIPITAETLKGALASYANYIGIDSKGNPSGVIKDAAAYDLFDYAKESSASLVSRVDDFNQFFLSAGVTSAQEAWASPRDIEVYRALAETGKLAVRMTLAPSLSRDRHLDAEGHVRVKAFIDEVSRIRDSLDGYPKLKADSVKIMVDGVAEFPTQTAALKAHYLQFAQDDNGNIHYTQGRAACAAAPCPDLNYGIQELPQNDLNEVVVAADKAGFSVHFHALGDAAVDAALTAVEAARAANPNNHWPHNLSHLQQVDPADVPRFGPAGVFITPTMAWFAPWYAYDKSVIPYFDEHKNVRDFSDLYDQSRPYIQNLYPIKSLQKAGAVVAAGSDVPVDAARLRPFTDIMYGLLRGDWQLPPTIAKADATEADYQWINYNKAERLGIEDLLDAYTINGARAIRQDSFTGSLEVGKKADVIIINQDIIAAAHSLDQAQGQADVSEAAYSICDAWYGDNCRTQVLNVFIDGREVYTAARESD